MTALTTRTLKETLPVENLPSNEERWAAVRSQKSRQSFIYWLSSAAAFLLFAKVIPLSVFFLHTSSSAATAITKCARVEAVFEALNKEFNDTDMQVFPLLKMVEPEAPEREYDQVDLYVRFQTPKKTQIFMTVRSMGQNTIVYSEKKESLLIKRRNRNRTAVEPCPLIGLNDNKQWLAKNRHVLDLSARDVTKAATAKVLVLWGDTQLAKHRPELYSEIGKGLYLTLFKGGTKTFVVEQERLATFVRDWLTQLNK